MDLLESARVLSYGIMVPVLILTGFIIYRRNLPLALFLSIQGCVYLVQLCILVLAPDIDGWSAREPVYSALMVIQAIAAICVIRKEIVVRKKLRTILYEPSSERFVQEEKKNA